jgi:hypothetical protein
MLFKNPDIFYFLFALLLPILVHLFQLQKFKKVTFTNVAFLQKIALQTRKSSQLKKWLILMTRLLLITAIIFAFSQPYFSSNKTKENQHNFIYLDNSLSLNTKGEKGNLLQNTINEIIENAATTESYSLLTNSGFHSKINYSELKNILLRLEFSSKNKTLSEVLLTINNTNTTKTNTSINTVLVSDFQDITNKITKQFTNVTPPVSLVQVKTDSKNNVSIDSVFINNKKNHDFTVNVVIKNQGGAKKNIPIAIYDDAVLISKQTFSIEENKTTNISFPIQNKQKFNGKINLDYVDAFAFDNDFFFTINSVQKTNILSIGKEANSLKKIYSKIEFNFTSSSLKNTNYNSIQKQELIILNELIELPNNLITYLQKHLNSGGHIALIPNENFDSNSYNSFFKKINIKAIQKQQKNNLKITNINFSHPFFKNVFTKNIRNFQYPFAIKNTKSNFKSSSALINFENNESFVNELESGNGKIYIFASSLTSKNSNFKNSPLIVPLFYNFGKLSFKQSKTYYTIGNKNQIDISTPLNKNEVLTINDFNSSFIPQQQQSYQHKTTLITTENPTKNGIYTVNSKNTILENIAFNYSRSESSLNFIDIQNSIKDNKNISYSSSVAEVLRKNNKKNEVTWVWKWFLALAIVSLIFEILILKLFKP